MHEKLTPKGLLEIQGCILAGQVDNAIALLQEHFPTVLRVDLAAVDNSQNELFSVATHATVTPESTDPAHLVLNLRIMDFIDAARTEPLPCYCPECARCQARSSSAPSSEYNARWRYSARSRGRPELLRKARKLFLEAKRLLKPADRLFYLGELARVTSAISYLKPEESELQAYFMHARRERLAWQIERAIFCMYCMRVTFSTANHNIGREVLTIPRPKSTHRDRRHASSRTVQ